MIFLLLSVQLLFASDFPSSYESAKSSFLRQKSQLEDYSFTRIEIPTEKEEKLFTDLLYLPQIENQEKRRLLILSSGVHGVEAFTGHALQMLFLKEFLTDEFRQKSSLLVIHAVNPYGFKFLRRVSENNVDLNRNFSVSKNLFQTHNAGYRSLYQMLNPETPASVSWLTQARNLIHRLWLIGRLGIPPMRQSILQGQYEHQRGLYFGGQDFEPQRNLLLPHLKDKMRDSSVIWHIDLHTGYGERGKLHLFGLTNNRTPSIATSLKRLFSPYPIVSGNDEDFYSVHGDFTQFTRDLTNEKQLFFPITFEYGTLDSQTTWGSLKSLDNMILENQGHHHGFRSSKDENEIKRRFREMYTPSDQKWRDSVIQQTRKIWLETLPRFLSF